MNGRESVDRNRVSAIGLADNLERRTNRRIDMMVRLLEPMMLLLMAAVVLFIIMALLLPVLNMSTTR